MLTAPREVELQEVPLHVRIEHPHLFPVIGGELVTFGAILLPVSLDAVRELRIPAHWFGGIFLGGYTGPCRKNDGKTGGERENKRYPDTNCADISRSDVGLHFPRRPGIQVDKTLHDISVVDAAGRSGR